MYGRLRRRDWRLTSLGSDDRINAVSECLASVLEPLARPCYDVFDVDPAVPAHVRGIHASRLHPALGPRRTTLPRLQQVDDRPQLAQQLEHLPVQVSLDMTVDSPAVARDG